MSPRRLGSAAAPGGVPESAERVHVRSRSLLTAMARSRAAARALLAALDAPPHRATALARAAERAHLAIAELWTLAEADVARRRK